MLKREEAILPPHHAYSDAHGEFKGKDVSIQEDKPTARLHKLEPDSPVLTERTITTPMTSLPKERSQQSAGGSLALPR